MKLKVSLMTGLIIGLSIAQLPLSKSAQAQPAAAQQEEVDGATPTGLTHRPLRSNQVSEVPPEPTEPESFEGYSAATPFSVVARKDSLQFFPCAQCHAHMQPNPEPRKLVSAPHPAALDHGGGRMWCVDCHSLEDRNHLKTIRDELVDFNDSYLVCGQCHADRQKDWYFGGHGKRAANWRGDREIYSCTHCHDPHSPGLKPRAPSDPPPVRAGLLPMPDAERHHSEIWQRYLQDTVLGESKEQGEKSHE